MLSRFAMRAASISFLLASAIRFFVCAQLIASIPQVADLDPFVCALGVPPAVEAKRGPSKAVHARLLDEINSLRGDLGRLSESDNRLRETTIAHRLVIGCAYERRRATPRTDEAGRASLCSPLVPKPQSVKFCPAESR